MIVIVLINRTYNFYSCIDRVLTRLFRFCTFCFLNRGAHAAVNLQTSLFSQTREGAGPGALRTLQATLVGWNSALHSSLGQLRDAPIALLHISRGAGRCACRCAVAGVALRAVRRNRSTGPS